MKKFLLMVLGIVLTFSLAGCGEKTAENSIPASGGMDISNNSENIDTEKAQNTINENDEENKHYVSNTIMGYDAYYIDEEVSPHFYTRKYFTIIDENEYCIAESYGMEIQREDTIIDIDNDGINELICNCVSGGDGHESIHIFKKNTEEGQIDSLIGNIDFDKLDLPGYFNWRCKFNTF